MKNYHLMTEKRASAKTKISSYTMLLIKKNTPTFLKKKTTETQIKTAAIWAITFPFGRRSL